ncbi:unnamed protein product [Nippostrongylus brasiliensis]|uniref:Anoctamin n=1 Tax=Nippostrongylus brasiliensis TaxID=27835 RepID=A0A0N4YDU4_NIPBR|nr:unnamed protein product [Nippostrongylus brasiliensis]
MEKPSGCKPPTHNLRATCSVDYPYFPFRIPVDYVLVSRTDDLSRTMSLQKTELYSKGGFYSGHGNKQNKVRISECPVNPAAPACCVTLSNAFVTDDTVDYISAPFTRRNSELFLNYSNEKLFFTSAQRAMLTHEIDISAELEEETRQQNSVLDGESNNSVIADQPLKRKGLQYLRMENTFEDSFILHEPSEVEPYFRKMKENSFVRYVEMMNEIETDPRKKLGDLWTRFARFQPLSVIREYFGEQIAFYFAWQGTFLTVLWPATIFGLVVFVFGLQKR